LKREKFVRTKYSGITTLRKYIMNKKTKALLIPIAAFAVTVTGASAFNSEVLEKAGLNDEQVTAFEQAHELRKEGDKEAAREVIMEAGIDMDTMHAVREAMQNHRQEMRSAIDEAVANEDYQAFLEAVEGSPIADIVTSEADFERFSEAHELREAGDKEAAHEIMEDLGFEPKEGHMKGHHGPKGEFEGRKEGRFNGFDKGE
jgi:transcriptional regulator of met regulon